MNGRTISNNRVREGLSKEMKTELKIWGKRSEENRSWWGLGLEIVGDKIREFQDLRLVEIGCH